jgi:iron complex transport system substrate-binding protein
VWAIDADGLVVRPGPRLVEGVEALAAILHPGPTVAAPADSIRRIA